jgi:hypothetical protein
MNKNKTILIARFKKKAVGQEMGENSFASNSLTDWNISIIFSQLQTHYTCSA